MLRGGRSPFFRERVEPIPEVDFHAIDLNPTPEDFETMTVTICINRLRQYVLNHGLGTVCVTALSARKTSRPKTGHVLSRRARLNSSSVIPGRAQRVGPRFPGRCSDSP